jgi:hypothetical protein
LDVEHAQLSEIIEDMIANVLLMMWDGSAVAEFLSCSNLMPVYPKVEQSKAPAFNIGLMRVGGDVTVQESGVQETNESSEGTAFEKEVQFR